MAGMHDYLGKFWFPQLLVIITLIVYSGLLTLGLGLVINNPGLFFPVSPDDLEDIDNYQIVLIFDSQVENKLITWEPIVVERNYSTTLFEVMNSTLVLEGRHFEGLGFLVEGINGLHQDSTNFWFIYYFDLELGWISSPVGVSSFLVHSNISFRFIYKAGN